MSSAIKNRLVGTIILVALAVIFLPDVLDGQKESNKEVFVELPERPRMEPVIETEPLDEDKVRQSAQPEVEIVQATPLDDPPVEQQQDESADAPVTETLTSDLQQQTLVEEPAQAQQSPGWVVQLGVFRHKKNVAELVKKLEAAGYRAFTRPVTTSAGDLTKVYVGPDVQKDKLEKALPHLQEVTNLKGKVTPFTVK